MKKFSKIKPYVLTSQKVYHIKNKEKILKLDWNEFPYSPSKIVKKDMMQFLKIGNINWYPNTYPKKLINKISKYSNVKNNNVTIFSGSDSILECICKLIIKKNDRVCIFFPNYDQFRVEANILEAKISYINILNYNFNINKIINAIKKICPKIIYISNPNNPIGNYYNNIDILKFIKKFPNVYFIIDEAYIEYSEKESFASMINSYALKNVFVMRTFSKCFGLASLRLGYCISSKNNISSLNMLKNHKSTNSLAICAGISTFKDIQYYKNKVKIIIKNRNKFLNYLKNKNIVHLNTFANFVLIKTNNKKKLLNYLLKNFIFIRDLGHIKGFEKYVRISIGTTNQMKFLIKKLNYFYKTHLF
jgi:histidinol-phosphate aminotransferase